MSIVTTVATRVVVAGVHRVVAGVSYCEESRVSVVPEVVPEA